MGTTLPRIPGRDFAGSVVEGPADLRGVQVWGTGGDIGYTRDGSNAEFNVIPAAAVVPKPANLTYEEAACVGVNFVTAYEGVVTRAKVKEGETLLVTGARGGVGQAVLKPAKISQRGSLRDAGELYSFVSRSGGGKSVFIFD